jgi:hypothetical protein
MSKKDYEIGSGNVFKDIGLPNAEEHLVKAQLVVKIDTIMDAARRLPPVLRGAPSALLIALDHDVHIVVKPHHDRKNAPALQVF